MNATRESCARIEHLLRRADFLRVQKSARKWVSSGVIVQVDSRDADAGLAEMPTRFGLVVSKKLDKRAVGRNRMRRRLRAAACDVLPGAAAKGLDIVLIGRHNTHDYPYDKLCGDLRWCLRKLGVTA